MSLTGPAFLIFVIALTVGCFLMVVLRVAGITGKGPRPVLARGGMMLGLNAMVLLTAAVILNDQFTFFADWTDLSGAVGGSQVIHTAVGGADAAQAAAAPVPPSLGPLTTTTTTATATAAAAIGQGRAATIGTPGTLGAAAPVLPPLPAGASVKDRVLRFTVTGTHSGLNGYVLVALPEGYTDPANAQRRYPVLETFNGYPGGPAEWVDSMNLTGALDQSVAAHKVTDPILIAPLLEFPNGVDTECVDGPGTLPKVETWIAQDVPEWVLKTFRVRPDRASWATIGLSAGGWCAGMVTMLHPDRFAAGVVMGGYFSPDFSHNYIPFGPKSSQAQRYDLVALTRRAPPPVAIWLETSHSDPISYPTSAALLKAARAPLSVQAQVLGHAGHRFGVWQAELPQVFAWLGANVPGFAPTAAAG